MKAKIFQPTKSAMQSGRANTGHWVLEFEPGATKFVEPLMGWTGSDDTTRQLRLRFDNQEAAIAYAKKHGIPYEVLLPKERRLKPKAYADNFSFKRVDTYKS